MTKRILSLLLASIMIVGLTGCKKDIPAPVVDTGPGETIQTNQINYSTAPPAQRWYGNQGRITAPMLESDITGETPFYTESEIKNLEHHSNIRIAYNGKESLSFAALEGDCSLYLEEDAINPYLEAAPYITNVYFEDSVTTLGAYTLQNIPNPISISLPKTITSANEPFTDKNILVSDFTIREQSDTIKVIGNGLYLYNPDRNGWELVKYATGNMATGFVLPSEINVVYIHKFAFAGNQSLTEIDLSSSKNLTMGFGAFADTAIKRIVLHEEYNPDIIYRNAGHTFETYQVGNETFTAAELGYTAVPNTVED